MTDYSLEIEDNKNILDIIVNNIQNNNFDVSSNILEINEQDIKQIILESSILTNVNNLEIQKYNDYNLILTNTVYANLPDEIPMSIITGNLHVSRIDGLDDYLTTIPIDGGSP